MYKKAKIVLYFFFYKSENCIFDFVKKKKAKISAFPFNFGYDYLSLK